MDKWLEKLDLWSLLVFILAFSVLGRDIHVCGGGFIPWSASLIKLLCCWGISN